MNANRAIALLAIVVSALVALTAIDKYDESNCRDASSQSISRFAERDCDGFLPW